MIDLRVALLAILSLFTAFISVAEAAQWTLDKDQSSLGFTVLTTQAKIEAQFETYDAQITLDPADLAAAKVAVDIDIASARTGNAQNDGAIASPTWMGAAAFPKATFTSTAIRNTGSNAYEMDGMLSLHGVEQTLTIPFSLDINGNEAVAKGDVDVIRTDFGIGQGPFASGDQVELSVKVRFQFTATK